MFISASVILSPTKNVRFLRTSSSSFKFLLVSDFAFSTDYKPRENIRLLEH